VGTIRLLDERGEDPRVLAEPDRDLLLDRAAPGRQARQLRGARDRGTTARLSDALPRDRERVCGLSQHCNARDGRRRTSRPRSARRAIDQDVQPVGVGVESAVPRLLPRSELVAEQGMQRVTDWAAARSNRLPFAAATGGSRMAGSPGRGRATARGAAASHRPGGSPTCGPPATPTSRPDEAVSRVRDQVRASNAIKSSPSRVRAAQISATAAEQLGSGVSPSPFRSHRTMLCKLAHAAEDDGELLVVAVARRATLSVQQVADGFLLPALRAADGCPAGRHAIVLPSMDERPLPGLARRWRLDAVAGKGAGQAGKGGRARGQVWMPDSDHGGQDSSPGSTISGVTDPNAARPGSPLRGSGVSA
jgi:hypothetical protein